MAQLEDLTYLLCYTRLCIKKEKSKKLYFFSNYYNHTFYCNPAIPCNDIIACSLSVTKTQKTCSSYKREKIVEYKTRENGKKKMGKRKKEKETSNDYIAGNFSF